MFIRYILSFCLVLFSSSLLAAQQGQTGPTRTDVPVSKVVLFSSGVGYFEHSGTVRGNGSTELNFRTNQINDILKSLVLQDQDGGRVSTITYPSQDPLSKMLRSFRVDIAGNPSMADLLNQLRGSRVTIESQADRVSGTILGVELRQKPSTGGATIEVPTVNVLTGAAIRSIELPSINSLELDDPQLQDELTKALAALNQARDQDKKPVTIAFTGSGERRVRMGYVVEAPVWKTSYRLLMDDAGGRLQGWAIVENQTESDWNGVSLSLVSGRPISFVMDLYQPLYATRPTVVPELFASLRPQVYQGATSADRERVELAAEATPPAGAPGRGGAAGRGGGRGGGGGRGAAAQGTVDALAPLNLTAKVESSLFEPAIDASSSVQSVASSANLGALFQYTVGNVTLARQKSAMLPIITDSIKVERVSIYNPSVLARHPLNGVQIVNTTEKHLLQGPITVLDKNSYAGDAQIDDVPPGQTRLLSYGIDLEVVVDRSGNAQVASITSAKIVKGVLQIDRKYVMTQEYLADNKSTSEKTLIFEHPIRQGWKLLEPAKPAESTGALYRFKGKAPAGKVTTLAVKEEIIRNQAFGLFAADSALLFMYSRTGEIPARVREALGQVMRLKQSVTDAEREVAARTQQINDISAEQNRIRENMRTVSQTTQYYQRLLAKLGEQESSIERLQLERDDLGTRRDAAKRELEDYVNNLTVE